MEKNYLYHLKQKSMDLIVNNELSPKIKAPEARDLLENM